MRCRRPLILTAIVAASAILVSGCGGGSSAGVANVSSSNSTTSSGAGSSPTQSQTPQTLKFVQCMHSNGVPSFPDPQLLVGGNLKLTIHQLAASPQVQTALSACRHLLPGGKSASQNPAQTRAQTVALLAFARCMRSHGFPSFPDPTGTGQLTHQMLAKARIDLHEPAVVQAADTCTGVTHGVITKAVVANFVAGH
jgi:hypothetical protein